MTCEKFCFFPRRRFDRPAPTGGPFARQTYARFAHRRPTGSEKWSAGSSRQGEFGGRPVAELDPSKLAKVTDPKRQRPRDGLCLGSSSPDRVPDPLRLLASLLPESAVVLMTAFGTPEVVKDALDLGGVYHVLRKPLRYTTLSRCFEKPATPVTLRACNKTLIGTTRSSLSPHSNRAIRACPRRIDKHSATSRGLGSRATAWEPARMSVALSLLTTRRPLRSGPAYLAARALSRILRSR
jgi:hypothetical protein